MTKDPKEECTVSFVDTVTFLTEVNALPMEKNVHHVVLPNILLMSVNLRRARWARRRWDTVIKLHLADYDNTVLILIYHQPRKLMTSYTITADNPHNKV